MPTDAPGRYRWRLVALSLAMLLPSLGTSIANVALPTIAHAFGVGSRDAQWVVIAYLLSVTTLVIVMGKLGDAFGRRRLLLTGIGLFGLSSIAAMLSTELWHVVALRGLQGVGAAAMMALTMAAVGDMVPKERMGSAMGLLATVSAVGTALGPSIGGAVLSVLSWPGVFGVMGIGAMASWISGYLLFPGDRQDGSSFRLEIRGMVILAATLAAYALASTVDFGPLVTAVLWGGAALGIGLFITVQMRSSAPLVDLRLLAEPVMSVGLASLAVISAIMMSTLVVGPFFLSQTLHLPPLAVGLVVSVGPAITAIVGVPAGRLVDRLGAPRVALFGLVAVLVGTMSMVALPVAMGTWGYIASIAAITTGYSLFQTSANTAIMAQAGAERRGVVAALLALARNIGLITGASAMGAIFAWAAARMGGGTGLSATFAVSSALIAAAIGANVLVHRRG